MPRLSTILLTSLGVVVAYLLVGFLYVPSRDLYEDASFALFPSAQKAYAYGELHFNGQDPPEYDIRRAQGYFLAAARLDTTIPYVHHEIARAYFVEGDLSEAMAQIDVQIAQEGDKTPNSYYVRGLIEGYMGDYADAAADYEHFLKFDPRDWAGINDYSWILLKAGRAKDAEVATANGLTYAPDNPWLLNTNATALYEMGEYKNALAIAQKALAQVQKLSGADWLHAYPGNDPVIAQKGIASFRSDVQANLYTIALALASSTAQGKVAR